MLWEPFALFWVNTLLLLTKKKKKKKSLKLELEFDLTFFFFQKLDTLLDYLNLT